MSSATSRGSTIFHREYCAAKNPGMPCAGSGGPETILKTGKATRIPKWEHAEVHLHRHALREVARNDDGT